MERLCVKLIDKNEIGREESQSYLFLFNDVMEEKINENKMIVFILPFSHNPILPNSHFC